jgi:type IV pilus assembly protein PilB
MLKVFDYEKTPVVEVVNEIMVDASKRGASDIHFDPQNGYVKIRIRIDGELIDYTEVPDNIARNLVTRVKILSGMNITESRLPQDGAIKAKIQNVDLDMRVSALPTNKGEKIVIRILDYSLSMAGLESLGFNDENLKKVYKMISAPNGIILVTGATGSGKSTTVYCILQKLNKENTNIISVEDPIEMDIDGVNQIQTNSEIGLDFATALRSILRQDPNIIMVGEIRDTETAKIAVRASITGHLVFSTIHTNNSLNTIERLLDMDVERYLLSSALEGIVSQKLARMLCPKCRKLRPTTSYEKVVFKKSLGQDVNEIYDVGDTHCEECRNGYKGRIAIQEVLLIDDYLRDAINDENLQREDLRKLVYTENVTTLLQDGLEKVLAGITSFNEIYKLIEIDDELDSHYSNEMLGNKIYTEELDKNITNLNSPTQPAQQIQEGLPTQPATIPPAATQAKTEEELGKTEVLDLGAIN